jgi:hypothetical protein
MEWTIEKVRELPEDNWLGIKRAGPYMWEISSGGITMYTGDGGVVEYCNCFQQVMKEQHEEYKGLLSQVEDGLQQTIKPGNLTYKELEELVRKHLF